MIKKAETFAVYCKRTGEVIAQVSFQENSGSCKCLSRDKCESYSRRKQ
jgi:hypothetical protein